MLDGEHAPGASEAGLYLVGDEQDAVLTADLLEAAQEGNGRREVTALTELGLDHDRRGLAGAVCDLRRKRTCSRHQSACASSTGKGATKMPEGSGTWPAR